MEQHAAIIRFWLLASLLFVVTNLSGQTKYFIMPDKPEGYNIDRYKLSTKQLYGVDKVIEIFTLTLYDGQKKIIIDRLTPKDDRNLILFSVLPDLEGNNDWVEINIDSIKNDIVPPSDLIRLFRLHTFTGLDETHSTKTKYFDEYQIIKKIDTKYYASKHCLLQFFAVRNRPSVFQNIYGTINTEQDPITIAKMEIIFKKKYPKSDFPPYTIGDTPYSYNAIDFGRERKEYLSKVIKLKNNDLAYQFWTYTNWHAHAHEYEIDRGIDRFVYLPGKGIIGGSFDFYFYFHRKKLPIKYADFMNNIKEEKVMIADIFK